MWLYAYELKREIVRAARKARLPFFTRFGWLVIIGCAFAAGLIAGIALAAWTLAARGLIG